MLIALVVVLVVGQWLRDYRAGRELYAIGSNPEGARLAGVRSDRRVLTAFVLAGALAGLGGVLFTARFGTVDATAGTGYELTVIAAAVVGGVAIFGGTGSVYGAALGALLLGTITSSLIVLRVEAFWQQAAIGALLLLAIAFDRLVGLRVEAALARRSARRAGCHRRPPPRRPRRRRAGGALRGGAARARARALGDAARRPARRDRDRVGQALSPEFLTADSFTTGSLDLSEVALMALPLALVIVAAEIDLSVASVLALSSAVMASLWNAGLPIELIMPICLVVGALCGAFNGVLVTRSACRRWRSRSARSRCSAASPTWSSATSR